MDYPQSVEFHYVNGQSQIPLTPVTVNIDTEGSFQSSQGIVSYNDYTYFFDSELHSSTLMMKVTSLNQKRVSQYSNNQNASIEILEVWFSGY